MLQKISLFNTRRDFLFAFFFLTLLSFYSLLIEYNNYKNLTRFDTQLVEATLLKQYTKNASSILKLKSNHGAIFYTKTKQKNLLVGENLLLKVWAGKISFYAYLKGFYAYSKIVKGSIKATYKTAFNTAIAKQHKSLEITAIYQALFSARQLDSSIQKQFSSLGISHLLAISGFHLGVLSTLLFFLLKYPYHFLQNRYFPYRNKKRDLFVIISMILLSYLLFLGTPASLLRAFAMLLMGFVLYDRGFQIISMQTLLLSILLLLALFPRLFFSLGFGLSVAGVGYIFLFLIHFQDLGKKWQFLLLPFWIYLMMLPFSLAIFENFSLYHPLSILWSTLFSLFYPLSIFLHLIHEGNLLDTPLEYLVHLDTHTKQIVLHPLWLVPFVLLSLGAIYKRSLLTLTLLYASAIFLYAIIYSL